MRVKKFAVLTAGSNVLTEVDHEIVILGFYANRFIETDSIESAKGKALEIVQKELGLFCLNAKDDPPQVWISEIDEIETFPNDALIPGKGFSFFEQKRVYKS